MNETTDEHSAAWPQPNSSPSRFLRVLRVFAVKVQPRIHREAAKSAKISRRKILSCRQRIFGLVLRINTDLCSSVVPFCAVYGPELRFHPACFTVRSRAEPGFRFRLRPGGRRLSNRQDGGS